MQRYRELVLVAFAFNQVSLSDIRSWFAHCCYCISPI
ncbi:hypothetical protein PCC7424_5780 (plasmid) [Gloeothece citriformis PCC 7424]|uniref:Uncharacterized protein n=1 Tax=Gloeothece citriformis (strain PCC 7424) TaxID=65393 RepID=B7KM21_GLOC7|nr:hypothetical protein PCC7424_5780 [Gloeothece citriformis PCC 7424]